NGAVLRARLRFDINGFQLGVVATRVASATAAAGSPVDQDDQRCQLCLQPRADSRQHLITSCPMLNESRTDVEIEMQYRESERRGGAAGLRVASYKCKPKDALLRFLLGQLNCIDAIAPISGRDAS